jgi:hypothetical protein
MQGRSDVLETAAWNERIRTCGRPVPGVCRRPRVLSVFD